MPRQRGNTSTCFGRTALRGRTTRVLGLLSVTLAVALGAAATASAQGPTVEQFRFTGVDDTFGDELSVACGLDVTVNADAHETHVFYADGRELDLIHYYATYVVAGQVKLIEDEDFRLLIDPAAESVSVSGVDYRLLSPDGTTLLKNSGSIRFTPSDGLSWHGPHPGITEGFDVCGALAT